MYTFTTKCFKASHTLLFLSTKAWSGIGTTRSCSVEHHSCYETTHHLRLLFFWPASASTIHPLRPEYPPDDFKLDEVRMQLIVALYTIWAAVIAKVKHVWLSTQSCALSWASQTDSNIIRPGGSVEAARL